MKLSVYIVEFIDGKSATMLCMQGASLDEATASAHCRFSRARVKRVVPKDQA
jgi:hypothetical protein